MVLRAAAELLERHPLHSPSIHCGATRCAGLALEMFSARSGTCALGSRDDSFSPPLPALYLSRAVCPPSRRARAAAAPLFSAAQSFRWPAIAARAGLSG